MLPSIEQAYNVHGRGKKVIAGECGVTATTLYKWETGRRRCPKHKRQSLDRAYGQSVDWTQYDAEFHACNRLPQAQSDAQEANCAISSAVTQKTDKATPAPAQRPVDTFEEMYGGLL